MRRARGTMEALNLWSCRTKESFRTTMASTLLRENNSYRETCIVSRVLTSKEEKTRAGLSVDRKSTIWSRK
jgi:hypothetical protein